MRFGIISSAHAHVFSFVEEMLAAGCVCVGIAEDGEENTKRLARQHGLAVYPTAEALLQAGIQVAGSFAPNARRIEEVELCERYQTHVMCDKPLVIHPADLSRLRAVAARGEIQVGMMFTLRFDPALRALYDVVQSGELGDIVNVEIFNPHQLRPERRPGWLFSRAEGGSVAVDLLTHSIDLLYWLTGRDPIVAHEGYVTKSILPEKPEFYDLASALVRTGGGVTGYFRSDWHMPPTHWAWGDTRVFCTGATGYAEARAVGDPVTREAQLIVFSPEYGTQARPLSAPPGTLAEDFLARIAGQPCLITQEDVLYTCSMALEMDEAAKENNRLCP